MESIFSKRVPPESIAVARERINNLSEHLPRNADPKMLEPDTKRKYYEYRFLLFWIHRKEVTEKLAKEGFLFDELTKEHAQRFNTSSPPIDIETALERLRENTARIRTIEEAVICLDEIRLQQPFSRGALANYKRMRFELNQASAQRGRETKYLRGWIYAQGGILRGNNLIEDTRSHTDILLSIILRLRREGVELSREEFFMVEGIRKFSVLYK